MMHHVCFKDGFTEMNHAMVSKGEYGVCHFWCPDITFSLHDCVPSIDMKSTRLESWTGGSLRNKGRKTLHHHIEG